VKRGMTPERWRQVTELFHAALVCEASGHTAYSDQACAGDRTLRKEVDAMLAAHQAPRGFGERLVSESQEEGPRLASGAMIGAYRIDRLIGSMEWGKCIAPAIRAWGATWLSRFCLHASHPIRISVGASSAKLVLSPP
jgi:hypothetical protein